MKIFIFTIAVYCTRGTIAETPQSKRVSLSDILRLADKNWRDLQARDDIFRSWFKQDNAPVSSRGIDYWPTCKIGGSTDDGIRGNWSKLRNDVANYSRDKLQGCSLESIKNAMLRLNNVQCNGVMISSTVGLSASHCFIKKNGDRRKPNFTTVYGNADPTFHPRFQYSEEYGLPLYDIARFKTQNSSDSNKNNDLLKCLLMSYSPGKPCQCRVIINSTSSYGKSSFVAKLVNLSRCSDKIFHRDDILCATSHRHFQRGDSGSPVVCRYKNPNQTEKWYIRGVVTYFQKSNKKVAFVQLLVEDTLKLAASCQFNGKR